MRHFSVMCDHEGCDATFEEQAKTWDDFVEEAEREGWRIPPEDCRGIVLESYDECPDCLRARLEEDENPKGHKAREPSRVKAQGSRKR
jgi:hypothetical protein